MLQLFSSRFMHYRLDMRLLQVNHNMLCDIHIFFCNNNNSRSVTFQHPRADNCRMLSPRASKILRCFFVQRKFCVAFSCEKTILRVFSLYNVCNNFFFVVQLVQRKHLWKFKYRNESAVCFSQIETKLSYLAMGKNNWTHVCFRTESKSRNAV